jgi:hypothetical protein
VVQPVAELGAPVQRALDGELGRLGVVPVHVRALKAFCGSIWGVSHWYSKKTRFSRRRAGRRRGSGQEVALLEQWTLARRIEGCGRAVKPAAACGRTPPARTRAARGSSPGTTVSYSLAVLAPVLELAADRAAAGGRGHARSASPRDREGQQASHARQGAERRGSIDLGRRAVLGGKGLVHRARKRRKDEIGMRALPM